MNATTRASTSAPCRRVVLELPLEMDAANNCATEPLSERLARIESCKRMDAGQWTQAPDVQRQIETLHQLGPRALLEFLAATGARNQCVADICDRLATWTAYSPETVRAVGGDRMVPRNFRLVPEMGIPGGKA